MGMTPERTDRLMDVLRHRQQDLTVLMENVFDPHNISAVMRTCDAVGIQEIYILNDRIAPHKKWGQKSSSTAAQWLSIHQYTDADRCFEDLRKKFPRILCSYLGNPAQDLYELDFSGPVALVFGNETDGVSPEVRRRCDGDFLIPQVGIIRSLNISVACAVTLYEAFRQKRIAGHYRQARLSAADLQALQRDWGILPAVPGEGPGPGS